MQIKISKDAAKELEAAVAWYEKEQAGLGMRLQDAFDLAISLLRESNPPLTPMLGNAAVRGAKRLLLHRFPFSLIVLIRDNAVLVIAFAHHGRKPAYWVDRKD